MKKFNLNKLFILFLNSSFSKFIIIGGITFLLYYFFLWFFFGVLKIFYIFSVALSYIISVSFHFFANKILTFNNVSNTKNQYFKYFSLSLFNYLVQILIIKFLYDINSLNFYLSAFFASLTTMLSAYLIMKRWVFKEN